MYVLLVVIGLILAASLFMFVYVLSRSIILNKRNWYHETIEGSLEMGTQGLNGEI